MSLGTVFFSKMVKKGDDKRLAGQKKPEGVSEINDIPYIDDGHKYHMLDIYKPEGVEGKLPVIVDIHGGGWVYGDKELNKYYCLHLAKQGFAVVNVSYRLCPEVTYVGSLNDINVALDWVVENAEKFGMDKDNVFITGDSAGGHYCSLVLAAKRNEALQQLFLSATKIDVKAVGFSCAVYEPSRLANIPLSGAVLFNGIFGRGYKYGKNKTLYKAAEFVNYIPDDMPPTFIITAYADFLRAQNTGMYATLKAKGVECELVDFDAPLSDGNKLAHVYNVVEPWWEASIIANKAMCDFFKKHIKKD